MTDIRPLKIGIIGLASIARNHIVPNLLRLKNHYIIQGIASRKNNGFSEYAKDISTKYYGKYQDLIDDQENLYFTGNSKNAERPGIAGKYKKSYMLGN